MTSVLPLHWTKQDSEPYKREWLSPTRSRCVGSSYITSVPGQKMCFMWQKLCFNWYLYSGRGCDDLADSCRTSASRPLAGKLVFYRWAKSAFSRFIGGKTWRQMWGQGQSLGDDGIIARSVNLFGSRSATDRNFLVERIFDAFDRKLSQEDREDINCGRVC